MLKKDIVIKAKDSYLMLLISEIAEIKKNEKNFLVKMDIEKAFLSNFCSIKI